MSVSILPASNAQIDRLRREARLMLQLAINTVDAGTLTQAVLTREAKCLEAFRRIVVVACGKCAMPMAEAAKAALGGRVGHCVVVTTAEAARPLQWARVLAAGHPIPDDGSLRGGAAIMEALEGLKRGDLVLALISGGSSSLVSAPRPGIGLSDKAKLSELLLRSGATITEMNAVRAVFSEIKGGGLARLAGEADVLALLVSDVPGDDPAVIGSGLTAEVVPEVGRAREIVERYGLLDQVTPAIVHELQRVELRSHGKPVSKRRNIVIGTNAMALDAVEGFLRRSGRTVTRLPGWLAGDVSAAAGQLHEAMLRAADGNMPAAVIAGGETSVVVTGSGRGGRNQELALRIADLCAQRPLPMPWAFVSGGSDGRDGPTDASGGIVDSQSHRRLRRSGADVEALLRENDSYAALTISGDLIPQRQTGTNIADVQIALIGTR